MEDEFAFTVERDTVKLIVPAAKMGGVFCALLRIDKTYGPIEVGSVHYDTVGEPISFLCVVRKLFDTVRRVKTITVLKDMGAMRLTDPNVGRQN